MNFNITVRLIVGLVVGVATTLVLPQTASAQRTLAITGATIETVGKEGTIENGTLLVKDGKISAVGTDVKIPVSAQRIDATGKTVIPGIVDPYYVVSIPRDVTTSAPRTIVFNGRVFTIGGGTTAVATTFAKVADGFAPTTLDWSPALRSGITSFHVVSSGYSQSLLAKATEDAIEITEPDGSLTVTVTTTTKTIDIVRNGLKEKGKTTSGSPKRTGPTPEQIAALRARFGSRVRIPTTSRTAPTNSTSAKESPLDKLWSSVRDGKAPLFVNVNNAASILHVERVAKKLPKARLALIASGTNTQLAIEALDPKRHTLIIPPAIDLVPNSNYRINLAKMLAEREIDFAFSLSLGQSDYRAQQDVPLFAVAMLVRSGLDAETALKALTITPAKLLGIEKEVGSLEPGKRADFVIVDGSPFAATTGIEQVFVEGKPTYEN